MPQMLDERVHRDSLSVAKADWFRRPETQAIFTCLNQDGFEARAVGGAVRNALLGQPVSEVDFATTARPEDTLRLAAKAVIKAVPTGIEHGTVTLVVNGTPFEVTTLRADIETHGRRATVAFGGTWEDDARRRDFTINALYADASGSVHDPLGGLGDLEARRVRFVGDARERIREDYLRILRFFRFTAEYSEGPFDREGVSAAIRERRGLALLSRERIRAELLRILVARRAPDAIESMDEAGLLLLLLGGVSRRHRFNLLCQLEAKLGLQPDPIYRLAALGTFIKEDAERLSDRLRLSARESSDLAALAATPKEIIAHLESGKLYALLYRLGSRLYLGRLLLAWASSTAFFDDKVWVAAARLEQGWERPRFPVTGGDLLARGFEPGPELGALLRQLEDRWIESGFSISREALLKFAESNGPPVK